MPKCLPAVGRAGRQMSNECQISKPINNPPSPPFSKGGLGGFAIGALDLIWHLP